LSKQNVLNRTINTTKQVGPMLVLNSLKMVTDFKLDLTKAVTKQPYPV